MNVVQNSIGSQIGRQTAAKTRLLKSGSAYGECALQKLMVEVYKTLNHLNPPYMWGLVTKKVVEYDFRIKILCKLPPAIPQRFGTNSLKFKGSLLWNSLSDDIKTAKSLAIFKQKIKSWNGTHCTCNICRN